MMAYGKNGVVTGMDRVALAVTGQDAATGIARRLAIFGNLVFMAASIVGLILTVQGQSGRWLVFVAMISSSAYSGAVEYQQRGKAPRDERERAVFWKALGIGAFVPCVLAGLWAVLLGHFADQGMWYPDRSQEWEAAGLFILGLMIQITNIAKAWLTPAYAAELLDDD
ncbi:hypothetical protein [Blastomonas fulva]|uniref:GtrA-like protein domain-containing protein n=1 Tax=Blastomonas fulva TaxID=1550728 RepID=A0ABN5BA52_9SPHN|nr:hypothetical protein [Blastomonas fulva]ASR53767.1 hypothetical protein B5J99_19250 [Blastomonas fulva]